MSDEEVQAVKRNRSEHEIKAAIVGLSGFTLSLLIILWALIILVRFYIFDSILYNLFLFCMLATGIVCNMASINLLLIEVTETSDLLPFIIGIPVSMFWTIATALFRVKFPLFFSQFSMMPTAIYDSSFYDGLGYDPKNVTTHPFTERFNPKWSFFNNTTLIFFMLITFAIAQIIFWTFTIVFYWQLNRESKHMAKQNVEGCSKHL